MICQAMTGRPLLPDEVTCPDCRGIGTTSLYADDRRQCPTCSGFGTVPVKADQL
jgi:DnaJ-class molecular chaperone